MAEIGRSIIYIKTVNISKLYFSYKGKPENATKWKSLTWHTSAF